MLEEKLFVGWEVFRMSLNVCLYISQTKAGKPEPNSTAAHPVPWSKVPLLTERPWQDYFSPSGVTILSGPLTANVQMP